VTFPSGANRLTVRSARSSVFLPSALSAAVNAWILSRVYPTINGMLAAAPAVTALLGSLSSTSPSITGEKGVAGHECPISNGRASS
jgi:hypothetical protein